MCFPVHKCAHLSIEQEMYMFKMNRLLDSLTFFFLYRLRKTVGKVSPILVTLTSRSDSDFEQSNVSLKENKPDGASPNSIEIDYYVRKNEGKNSMVFDRLITLDYFNPVSLFLASP